MKTNFKEYLKNKNTQKRINTLAQEFSAKKIVLFGAGLFAGDLIRNYDLSGLDIVAVADLSFKDDSQGEYYGYKKISPLDLLEMDFDLILITEFDDTEIKKYLKKDLFQGEDRNLKIKTLVNMNVFEYINALVKGDL